jgi:hypothetical protein
MAMSQPDPNPYASPDEKSAPLSPHRGSALVFLRHLANAAFVFALVGPPIAFVCALSMINFGMWNWLDYVIPRNTPPAFALLLFLSLKIAAYIIGVSAYVGSAVAAIICLILGKWRQRVAVVLAWMAYLLFVLFIVPLLRL